MTMSRLNIFRGFFLAAILLIGVRAEYNSAKLEQRLTILEEGIYYNTSISDNTAMKLETFLQELSTSFESEVEAVARPIAKEEVINGFKVLAEQFNKDPPDTAKFPHLFFSAKFLAASISTSSKYF